MSVDAARLLKDLREAWEQTGSEDQQGHGVLRACSMTLLVLAGSDDDPQQLGATLADLMHSHPSRTVVLRLGERGSELGGQALIQCWMPFGRRQQICCEQIELRCPEDQISVARSAVLGLLVPDLPVNIWLRNRRWLAAEGLETLLGLASKVIVDGVRGCPFPAADLVWCRLTRWRETVEQVVAANAAHVTSVDIRHAGTERPLTAIYLAAWLRAQLGAAVGITIQPAGVPLPPKGVGRIWAVHLEGAGFSASLARASDTEVVMEYGTVRMQVPFPVFTEEILLREELSVFGRDVVFEKALAAASEF